jgi:hypothetical protein
MSMTYMIADQWFFTTYFTHLRHICLSLTLPPARVFILNIP